MLEISIGLVAGLLIGLTGVGVGTVMTALLVLLTPISTVTAVGTSLGVGVVTKLVGVIEHQKFQRVNYRLAGFLLAGSIPGTFIGAFLLHALKAQLPAAELDSILKHALAFTMLATALLLPLLRGRKRVESSATSDVRYPAWRLLGIGLAVGVLVSITSIGSGSVTMLLLLLLLALPTAELVGTDIFYGLITVTSAAALHLWMGHVDSQLWLRLLVGSLPGVVIGSRLAGLISEKGYSWIYSALYLSIATRLILA
ncbi:MAG: sulfite exporter TauE/SafE family protein [Acidobacteria bacterium]|nr:sulfite exporter TauE/SafE family protein [Acidobacteriota bacterium]